MPCLEIVTIERRIISRLGFRFLLPSIETALLRLPLAAAEIHARGKCLLRRFHHERLAHVFRVLALGGVFLDEGEKLFRRGGHFIELGQAGDLHLHRPLQLGGSERLVVVEFHPRFIDERALGGFWIRLEIKIHSLECLVGIKHGVVQCLLAGPMPIGQGLVEVLVLIDPWASTKSVHHRRRGCIGLRDGERGRLANCQGIVDSWNVGRSIHQRDVGDFECHGLNF